MSTIFIIAVSILGLMVCACIGLWANQQIAVRRIRLDHPAPGRLISIQGHHLHLNCAGQEQQAPVIVIDAGNGSSSLDWANFQRTLSDNFRVCTYDRAGYAWSEAAQTPRDADHIVSELHHLLAASGEPGPYLLVGHSLGGLHLQLYAARYPQEVAGMILVESPGADLKKETFEQQAQVTMGTYRVMHFLAASGLLRFLGPLMGGQTLPGWVSNLTETEREAYVQMLLDPRQYETAQAEMEAIYTSAEQLKSSLKGEKPLGELPIIVLTAGMVDVPQGNNPFATRREPVDPQAIARQKEIAQLSSRGEQRLLPRSGHLVQHDDPAAIRQAIVDVTRAIADGKVQP